MDRGARVQPRRDRRLRVRRPGRDRHLRRHRREPRPGPPQLAGRPARQPAEVHGLRRPGPRGRPDDPDHPVVGRRGDQPRPDVALHRGHPQLGPDLGEPRHPDPPRPVVAVALGDRRAVPGAVPPRLRLPRHPRRDHAHRLRLLVVRADPEGDREGVRAVGLRAEPRPDRQGHQAAAQAGAGRARPGRSRRSSSTARTSWWPTT